jgi:hypothetical protein
MNRYVNLSISCATAALIGIAAGAAAQQPAPSAGATGTAGAAAQRRGAPPATQNPPANPPAPARGRGGNRGNTNQGSAVPAGTTVTTLGPVRIAKAVKADGQSLAAGTYQLRVTEREASPAAPGQTPQYERWAEFLQGGQVKGREVVTIVPQSDIAQVAEDRPPRPGAYRAEVLKGGDYYRLWFNKGGNHYLVHFNIAT